MDGEFVRELRSRLGMTQSEMCLLVGVHRTTIMHWEKHRTAMSPRVQRLMRVISEKPDTIPLLMEKGLAEKAERDERDLAW